MRRTTGAEEALSSQIRSVPTAANPAGTSECVCARVSEVVRENVHFRSKNLK